MTIHDIKKAGIKTVQVLCRVCARAFEIPEFKLKGVVLKGEPEHLPRVSCRCPECVKKNVHTREAYKKYCEREFRAEEYKRVAEVVAAEKKKERELLKEGEKKVTLREFIEDKYGPDYIPRMNGKGKRRKK